MKEYYCKVNETPKSIETLADILAEEDVKAIEIPKIPEWVKTYSQLEVWLEMHRVLFKRQQYDKSHPMSKP